MKCTDGGIAVRRQPGSRVTAGRRSLSKRRNRRYAGCQSSRNSRGSGDHRGGGASAFDCVLDCGALSCQCPLAATGLPALRGSVADGFLREVRLRRAHQNLLESNPSTTSVASVAYKWGFTNLGRFAAAHTACYDEPPAATLRRRVLCEPNRMSDMPGEVPGQLLQNEARAHNRVTSVRRGSTVKRQGAVTVAEAGCQRCSS